MCIYFDHCIGGTRFKPKDLLYTYQLVDETIKHHNIKNHWNNNDTLGYMTLKEDAKREYIL